MTQGFDYRSNTGVSGGYTSTLVGHDAARPARSAARASASGATRRRRSIRRRSGFSSTAVRLMNGYQYLPFFTFGSFSSTNSGSTIASLGSMRSDWNDGFDATDDARSRSRRRSPRSGATHTSRARLRAAATSVGTSRTTGYPAGRYLVQRRVHAREQLGRASTIARSPGRSSCSGCRRRRPARWPRRQFPV